jgi:enoyl-CoA hydratase
VIGAGAGQRGTTAGYSRYQSIKVEKQDGIAILTLNRPEKLNVVDATLHTELEHIWQDVAGDREVRVVVFTGAGEAFCAGADPDFVQRLRADSSILREVMGEAGRLIRNMLEVPQPIIAAVNGDAMSLGATMVLFCDIIIAADTARLADTHVNYGIVAGDGGAVIWPLLIGMAKAKEFLMTGKPIPAAEAERLGLINYVVPAGQVMARAMEMARQLASGTTQAIQGTKASVNKVLRERVDLILDTSLALEQETLSSPEHQATT